MTEYSTIDFDMDEAPGPYPNYSDLASVIKVLLARMALQMSKEANPDAPEVQHHLAFNRYIHLAKLKFEKECDAKFNKRFCYNTYRFVDTLTLPTEFLTCLLLQM